MGWDEAKHPRAAAGTPAGGQFTPKESEALGHITKSGNKGLTTKQLATRLRMSPGRTSNVVQSLRQKGMLQHHGNMNPYSNTGAKWVHKDNYKPGSNVHHFGL